MRRRLRCARRSPSSTNAGTRSSRGRSCPLTSPLCATRSRLTSRRAPSDGTTSKGSRRSACTRSQPSRVSFDRLIEDDVVFAVAEALLGADFLLTAALAINLGPEETAQNLHYDELFYGLPRPRNAVSLSTLWAIDDFSADNGGTLMVPGSHRWGDERPDAYTDVVPLEMPAGSVAIYPGTFWHAGGANVTDAFRLGISIQYCVSWARQQESYLLEFPPERARELSPRLRALLGYSIGPAFMGHVDGRHPEKLVEHPGA